MIYVLRYQGFMHMSRAAELYLCSAILSVIQNVGKTVFCSTMFSVNKYVFAMFIITQPTP